MNNILSTLFNHDAHISIYIYTKISTTIGDTTVKEASAPRHHVCPNKSPKTPRTSRPNDTEETSIAHPLCREAPSLPEKKLMKKKCLFAYLPYIYTGEYILIKHILDIYLCIYQKIVTDNGT